MIVFFTVFHLDSRASLVFNEFMNSLEEEKIFCFSIGELVLKFWMKMEAKKYRELSLKRWDFCLILHHKLSEEFILNLM
jgi:hypothetical protein